MNVQKCILPPLSERLKTVAGMVSPGRTAADVGCDHGYTAIYLRLTGVSPSCICTDINEGPLAAASENIKKYKADKIKTVCADGLLGIRPGEAESIIIAGMGGELICEILKKGKEVVWAASELILGPHSEPEKVRNTIYDLGLCIISEALVEEDGKFYPIIKAVPASYDPDISNMPDIPNKPDTHTQRPDETEMLYGPFLLASRDPVLLKYLKKELAAYEKALENLELNGANTLKTVERKRALKALMDINKNAQEFYKWNTETQA